MATLGLSKVFILDKYFTELQKFWETEKKLQDASSNEAVHLQQRLKSLSTELVTLRNRLHVGQVGGNGSAGGVVGNGPAAAGLGGPTPTATAPSITTTNNNNNNNNLGSAPRIAQGSQMIICPNSAEFANNKLYGSSAAVNNSANSTNCHNSTFPGVVVAPVLATSNNHNSSSSTAAAATANGHNLGLLNSSQQVGGHKSGVGVSGGGGGAAPSAAKNKSYVPIVSPRNTSLPMPLPVGATPPESVLPHQLPTTAMSHQNVPQSKHNLLNPPLPIPSSSNNHFSPIQSPMAAHVPGLPVIQPPSKNHHTSPLYNNNQAAMAFNSSNPNPRMAAATGPGKVIQQNAGGRQMQPRPIFAEEKTPQPAHPNQPHLSHQSRGVRHPQQVQQPHHQQPQTVSYSNQLQFAGNETQVEVIEARQRKERLPLKDIEDLIHLSGPLTEDAVMKTLHTRFQNDSFYTNVGPILLAINPYLGVGNPLTLTSIRSLPLAPQMKKIVQETVRQQTETGYPQAIILSGTSGSGKTHCSMLLLRQLFDVAGGGHETDAFKHLAAAFTVLRSLGSAKTATNSESSRIGQFIEVQVTDGALYRTKIHCYFLDQTRVIRPLMNEKNYHIFYQMLAGLSREERVRLNLEGYSVHNLNYLQSGDTCQNEQEDAMRFQAWKTCLGILGIPFLDVVRVLSAVLLLGNVQFVDGLGLEVDVKGEAELNAVADLLGVPASALFRGLTTRTHNARGQLVKSVCDANMSNMTRDCLSKALYCRTVATIVRRANSLKRLGSTLGTLSSDSNESVHNQAEVASQHASTLNGGGGGAGSKSMAALNNAVRHATDGFIGILDMFGFEEPRPSHLEHLCINLCAETMQHFYNTHIFKSSVESCREEGIIYCDTEIDYVDNVPCIDLISSLRTGLLSMLDTECSVRGTSESYVAKIKAQHRNSTRLETKTNDPADPRMFTIRHFAGRVEYDCSSFLDTNRDVVPDDLVSVFYKSICNFGFVTHLFGSELKALYAFENVPRGLSFRIAPTSHTDVLNGDEPVSTLTQDFHTRLDNLLRTLVHARPHFVRCIRSNSTETPKHVDRATIVKQIRSLQVLETVNLMASGFPHRMRFKQFNARYRMLAPFNLLKRCEEKVLEDCKLILQLALKNPPELSGAVTLAWAPGKRHIFLSEGIRQHLEGMRSHIRTRSATMIQAVWRSWQLRRRVGSSQQRPKKNEPLIGSMGNKAMNILPISRMTNQMMTGTITRPRPQPIAGTPPPDPNEKCDSKIIQQTCTLFGLDLERPPPVPPSRSYTVTGNAKLSYPQIRMMKMNFPEDAQVGGQASEQLRKGEAVSVVGASERRGHLIVDHGGRQWNVPFQFMELVKSSTPAGDCVAAVVAGTTSLASVDI